MAKKSLSPLPLAGEALRHLNAKSKHLGCVLSELEGAIEEAEEAEKARDQTSGTSVVRNYRLACKRVGGCFAKAAHLLAQATRIVARVRPRLPYGPDRQR